MIAAQMQNHHAPMTAIPGLFAAGRRSVIGIGYVRPKDGTRIYRPRPATWNEMSITKRQPDYLDRQESAAKARTALLEKFRAKQESEEDFAKRQAALLEIRLAREAREAERKAAAEAARQAELARLAALKAEEEERARALAAEQKARRDARYASRKKHKKGLRYARPGTGG
jgi:hypothetical protein